MSLQPKQDYLFPVVVGTVVTLVLALVGLAGYSYRAKKPAPPPPPPDARPIASSGEPDAEGFLSGKASETFGDGDLTVWYRDAGDKVLLTLRSRGAVIVNADVDQNGTADRGADASYAVDDGKPCVQLLKPPEGSANCGDYPSAATVAVRKAGTDRFIAWSIPKREIAPHGKDPLVSFQTFDAREQKSRWYPGVPFSSLCLLPAGNPARIPVGPPAPAPKGQGAQVSQPQRTPEAGPVPPAKNGTAADSAFPSRKTNDPPQPKSEPQDEEKLELPLPPLPPKPCPDGSRVPVGQPCPQPPDPGPPRYGLTVYADAPLESGEKIKFGDPRLKNLGFAVRYSGPKPPSSGVRVEWWFNGARYSPFNFPLGDMSFMAPHQYDNVIHAPGKFEVRLLVGGEIRETFAFEVVKAP